MIGHGWLSCARLPTEGNGRLGQWMSGIDQGIDHREMIRPQHRNVFEEVAWPMLLDQLVLPLKFIAFESANSRDHRTAGVRGQKGCAQARNRSGVQLEITLNERRV